MRNQIVDITVGFILGCVFAMLSRCRSLILPFLATLALVLASDAAAAQQTTVYGKDGRIIGHTATDSQGSTAIYGAGGRLVGRTTVDSQGTTTVYGPDGGVIARESGTDLRKPHGWPTGGR